MKIKGTIYTEVEVDSFSVITDLCQTIGVVDENGVLQAKLMNDKILKISTNEFGNKRFEVLYEKPFDVQYAASLMRLYELSSNYLLLSDYMRKREDGQTEDYQTVKSLKLEKSKNKKNN